MDNLIVLTTEDGEKLELYVEEKTRINGRDYILATTDALTDDDGDEEVECYVFRDDSGSEDSQAVYVMVEDEDELTCVLDIFQSLMDDVSFEN